MRESEFDLEFELSWRRAELHGSRVPGYLSRRRSATTPLACDYALQNALFTLGEHRLLYSRAIEGTSERIVLGFSLGSVLRYTLLHLWIGLFREGYKMPAGLCPVS